MKQISQQELPQYQYNFLYAAWLILLIISTILEMLNIGHTFLWESYPIGTLFQSIHI